MRIIAAAVVLACCVGTASAQGSRTRHSEDTVASVRDLYAAASYTEALATLERFKATSTLNQISDLDRYEALCLMALGRTDDAERLIEGLVVRDPLSRAEPSDASPRIRATFVTVRKRLLPGVARTLYADGKRAYDRQAFAQAAETLERALLVIADPDAECDGIDDLQTLASGFLALSRASLGLRPQ